MAPDAEICQALLVRAGRGDSAAFAELYDRTVPEVFGLIRSVVPDTRAAEEITVEVYRQVWWTASRYDGDACTLLMTTAWWCARDRIRVVSPRDVLVLTSYCGNELPAVAEFLGIPRVTALSLLNQALSSLRLDSPAVTASNPSVM